MQITADPQDLKPPSTGRWVLPVVLALLAHALLMAALTWGIRWQKDEQPVTFEAEIWSSVPREAAPRAVQPPPPPPPPPEPVAKPEPRPEPPRAAEPPPDPAERQAEIATARKKKEEEQRRELADKLAKEKAQLDKLQKEKLAAEKAERALNEKKLAEEKRKLAEQKLAQERKEAERREAELSDKLRRDQLARMMGQAGASGGPEAQGSAQRSEGPSSGYGARVAARIRPNIRYTEDFPRTLRTEIEVRALADGTITSRRVVDSSGNPAWDEAALKAIDRTGSLPRDIDGRVPSPIIVVVRPTD